MKRYLNCARERGRKPAPVLTLPLFAWADARLALEALAMPRAARMLARRYALSPSIARLCAEQAGFSMEIDHG